jgi:hypothetical protein
MLADIGGPDVEIVEGWASTLSGGKEGQASALIDRLMNGDLPQVAEAAAPASDVLGPEQGEFVHEPSSLEGTPWEA